jgi:hypothetical protein
MECDEKFQIWLKKEKKYQEFYMKSSVNFIVAGDIELSGIRLFISPFVHL